MDNKILDDYRAYYAVRAEKYANNPNFPNYSAAEKRLSDLMQNATEEGDYKNKIGELSQQCAMALTKDQYALDKKHFDKHQETVRVLLSERILDKVDSSSNVNDLVTMVSEESSKNMIEISMDESNHYFIIEWEYVDLAEVYANAEVPEKYKADMQSWANDLRQSLLEQAQLQEAHNQHWQEGWKLNPDIIMEYRHRRLLPYTDEQILDQIERFKKIINA
ncbi:MAG: hypothetical protein V2A54_00730 [Bacteroidota bacterium]